MKGKLDNYSPQQWLALSAFMQKPFLALVVFFFLLPILIADDTKIYTLSEESIGSYLTSQVTLFIQGFLKIVSPETPSLHSGEVCCLIFKLCSFYCV